MKLGIPKEVHPEERLVAATPETIERLAKLGFEVAIERGAGVSADIEDAAYEAAGCEMIATAAELWESVDMVLKLRPPQVDPGTGIHEATLLREGGRLASFIWPAQNKELVDQLAARKATVIAMDAIPRVTRAQKMDARSSMANISGYRAVIEAAHNFGRFFTAQITAAGKVPPAKVLVIGCGVAGLAAIGAARGMGAIVRGFDTRSVVREQIESMGAEFLTVDIEEDGDGAGGYAKTMSDRFLEAERELFEAQAEDVDIIISTALIPGKDAPKLISRKAVQKLRSGSVIIDLAAEQGGNCELTVAGELVRSESVTIIGYTDFPSRMASVASFLYGNNLAHLLDDMGGAANFAVDEDDDVVRGALILNAGELRWPPPPPEAKPKPAAESPAAAAPEPTKPVASADTTGSASAKSDEARMPMLSLLLAGIALAGIGYGGDSSFLSHFTVFVLACFVGYQVIWNVAAALHTPLMSVTNAISGIILVGGMMQIGGEPGSPAMLLGLAAIFFATINIAGGFLVTQRMLKMFQR